MLYFISVNDTLLLLLRNYSYRLFNSILFHSLAPPIEARPADVQLTVTVSSSLPEKPSDPPSLTSSRTYPVFCEFPLCLSNRPVSVFARVSSLSLARTRALAHDSYTGKNKCDSMKTLQVRK